MLVRDILSGSSSRHSAELGGAEPVLFTSTELLVLFSNTTRDANIRWERGRCNAQECSAVFHHAHLSIVLFLPEDTEI